MSVDLGSAHGRITIDASGVTSATQQAKKSLESVGGSFMGVGGQAALAMAAIDLFTAAAERVSDAIASVVEGMIGGNKQFEQYETSFKVLLGNAELAKQRMEELADFGQRTPFELPGVVEADRVLQGFGLHAPDVTEHYRQMGIDIRTLTGDVAAGTGEDFKNIALNIGKFSAGATGEAIMRFQELGAVTRDELRAMGVEFDKSGSLISPLPEAMDALLMIMQQKYGRMMEEQSKTFGGMLSNLMDWKDNTLRELGEPIFEILKEKLQSFLNLLDSDAVKGALTEFTDLIRNTLNIIMDFANSISGGGGIERFMESFAGGLERANSFLTELRDRLRGFTVSDVMNELASSIKGVKSHLQDSLAELETSYTSTVTKISSQIENATTKLNEDLAEINEKYGEKAAKVEEKYAEARKRIEEQLADAKINFEDQVAQRRQALQERLENMEQQFSERKRAINEQIQDKIYAYEEKVADIRDKLEQKQGNLSTQHEKKKAELIAKLSEATTAEEKAEIEARLAAEDTEYQRQAKDLENQAKKQEEKEKKKHDRAVNKLKERLAREEQAYREQVEKEKKRAVEEEARMQAKYDRQVAKLQERLSEEDAKRKKQLAEIEADRAKDEAEVRESYNRQVEMLQQRLDAEKEAYEQNRANIIAASEEEIAALEAQAKARAEALSEEASGPMAQVLSVVDAIKTAFDKLSEILEFLKQHWESIKSALIAIGAVLAGVGIAAIIAGIAAAIAALATPLGAIVAAAALLGVAWGENWFGIREKTQAVIDFIWPKLQEFWGWVTETAIPKLKEWGAAFQEWLQPYVDRLTNEILPALWEKAQAIWGWITETAIPKLQEWGAAFRDGLMPHLTAIMDKLRELYDDIQPKLQEAWDKLLEVWNQVKDIWETNLKPALDELAEKLGLNNESSSEFMEILGNLVGLLLEAGIDALINDIKLAIDGLIFVLDLVSASLTVANGLIDGFKSAWDGIAEKVSAVKDGINEFKDVANNFKLPDILTPGSPTPFELGLQGIDSALQNVKRTMGNMPTLSTQSTDMASLVSGASGGSSTSTSHSLVIESGGITISLPNVLEPYDAAQAVEAKLQEMFGNAYVTD